ncbi:MAG: LytTR family DNA-binding domain-containing protein [Bacteroidetes bacterium]|nr:LytTR family DNA-binding domain-containing protein [Bacteroidota bacterium]MCZ6693396.1 LytTR family DNA-binding domain-containing protein [Bacteroidota bacterium]
MQKIRTAIIDDEPIARERVIRYLETDPEIKVVGEAGRGKAAVEFLKNKRPELIFLDIKMPDLNGFQVIEKLATDYSPYVVFITAYDSYAIKAFEVNAIDYLLKPYDKDRFYQSLNKAKQQIRFTKSSELSKKIMQLIKVHEQREMVYLETFVISEKGKNTYVDTDDIHWIAATGNYITLNPHNHQYLYRETMNTIQQQLEPAQFMRIHRSIIVNVNYIKKVDYSGKNEYRFVMYNGKKLLSGRSYGDQIKFFLSNETLSK